MSILRKDVQDGQCFRYLGEQGGGIFKIADGERPSDLPIGNWYISVKMNPTIPHDLERLNTEVELLEHYSTHPTLTPLKTQPTPTPLRVQAEASIKKTWPLAASEKFTIASGDVGRVYQMSRLSTGVKRGTCRNTVAEVLKLTREAASLVFDYPVDGDDKRFAFVSDAEMQRVLGPGVNNPNDDKAVDVAAKEVVEKAAKLAEIAEAKLAENDARIVTAMGTWVGISGDSYEPEVAVWTTENRAAWSRHLARLVKASEEARKHRESSVLVDLDFFE